MPDERCDLLCLDLEKAEALRSAAISEPESRRLSELAKAVSDPTRLALALAIRDGGELCVCDLSWIVGRSEKLVSHHLGLMRRSGMAASRREGKMVLYELTEHGRALLGALTAQPPATAEA